MFYNYIIIVNITLVIFIFTYLFISQRKKNADACRFSVCGFYDNKGTKKLDDHVCHHPDPQISTYYFNKIKGTNKYCPESSPYIGIQPNLHLNEVEKQRKNSKKVILIAIAGFLISMLPHLRLLLD